MMDINHTYHWGSSGWAWENVPGEIDTRQTVACGTSGCKTVAFLHHCQQTKKGAFVDLLQKAGWVNSRQSGWICPKCGQRRQNDE